VTLTLSGTLNLQIQIETKQLSRQDLVWRAEGLART
jgi:hypothetical protein